MNGPYSLVKSMMGAMSINNRQRQQVGIELRALRTQISTTDKTLAELLGYSVPTLNAILTMENGVDPYDVWRVRDFLVAVATEQGIDVPDFSILKDSGRSSAEVWFGQWDVPSAAGLSPHLS